MISRKASFSFRFPSQLLFICLLSCLPHHLMTVKGRWLVLKSHWPSRTLAFMSRTYLFMSLNASEEASVILAVAYSHLLHVQYCRTIQKKKQNLFSSLFHRLQRFALQLNSWSYIQQTQWSFPVAVIISHYVHRRACGEHGTSYFICLSIGWLLFDLHGSTKNVELLSRVNTVQSGSQSTIFRNRDVHLFSVRLS